MPANELGLSSRQSWYELALSDLRRPGADASTDLKTHYNSTGDSGAQIGGTAMKG
jgi:hypothetical protein